MSFDALYAELGDAYAEASALRSLTNRMLFSAKSADSKARTVGVKAAKDSKDSVLLGAKADLKRAAILRRQLREPTTALREYGVGPSNYTAFGTAATAPVARTAASEADTRGADGTRCDRQLKALDDGRAVQPLPPRAHVPRRRRRHLYQPKRLHRSCTQRGERRTA